MTRIKIGCHTSGDAVKVKYVDKFFWRPKNHDITRLRFMLFIFILATLWRKLDNSLVIMNVVSWTKLKNFFWTVIICDIKLLLSPKIHEAKVNISFDLTRESIKGESG